LKLGGGFSGEENMTKTERNIYPKSKVISGSGGFTLIELMMVIVILGTLASVAIPSYSAYLDKANWARTIADMRTIEKEILTYQAANGVLPDSLADIGRGTMLDPWGRPFEYLNIATGTGNGKPRKNQVMKPINTDFDLYSIGKDGKTQANIKGGHGRDDIIRASNGAFVGRAEDF
jgi:general secretion pathway protein G